MIKILVMIHNFVGMMMMMKMMIRIMIKLISAKSKTKWKYYDNTSNNRSSFDKLARTTPPWDMLIST